MPTKTRKKVSRKRAPKRGKARKQGKILGRRASRKGKASKVRKLIRLARGRARKRK
jgi:hypothetical protein